MKPALARYRFLAYATGVLLILLTLHVVLKVTQWQGQGIPYSSAHGLERWLPGANKWIPIGHGYLYLAYVVVTVDLWFRTRLPVVRTVLVVLAGTVPFMSFLAERWVHARVQPLIDAEATATAAAAPPR